MHGDVVQISRRSHRRFGVRSLGVVLAIGSIFAATAATAAAATVTVNDNTTGPGPAGANCLVPNYTTIQAAINGEAAGSTILVCAGTYNGGADVNKRLTLKGAQAGVDARTRAVPTTDESIVEIKGIAVGVDEADIDGFLIRDVDEIAPTFGPGLYLAPNTGDNRVANNIFRSNIFGMYLTNEVAGDTVVRHNWFDDNNDGLGVKAAAGNGIYGDFGVRGAKVDENKFTANENSALVLTEVSGRNSDVEITSNEVTDNQGIVVLLADDVLIADNTMTNVSTPNSGGPFSAIVLVGDTNRTTISGNRVTGASSAVRVTNAFDPDPNRNVTVSGNQLLANDYGVRIGDGGHSGLAEVHFNRIAGNTTAGIANEDDGDSIDAANNWFGCNAGPVDAACDAVTGTGEVDFSPWLVLGLSASPSTVYASNGQSQLTASLRRNSAGNVAGSGFPDNVAVAFAAPTLGTVNPGSDPTDAGLAQSLFSAGAATGIANPTATLDSEVVSTPVTIVAAPQGPPGPPGPKGDSGVVDTTPPAIAGACSNLIRGTGGPNKLFGTGGGDRILGFGANDVLKGFGGSDCLKGGTNNDKLVGGAARDTLKGGSGNDRIFARDGNRDKINCGTGRDVAKVDQFDVTKRCEKVVRKRR